MTKCYKEVNVLLDEDDDIDAKSVERGFSKLKLANSIYRARNGCEALITLRGNEQQKALGRPYIILLDLNMPVMGGLEFLQAIREDSGLQDSIFFILTTSAADEDSVAAYRERVAGYIIKSDIRDGFTKLIDMLDHYWRVVLLPA